MNIYKQKVNGTTYYNVKIRRNDKNVCKYFKSLKEAKEYLYKVQYENTPSNKKLYDVFLESQELFGNSFETKRKDNLRFKKYINLDIKIDKLKSSDIIKSLSSMVDDCSQDTIEAVLTIWHKICRCAVVSGYTIKDVSYGIIAPKSKKISIHKSIETNYDTLLKVIDCCKYFTNKNDRIVVPKALWAMYYTGARPSEVFALTQNDILLSGHLYINKELGSNTKEKGILRPTKTEMSMRKIPIVPQLLDVLNTIETDILFPNKNGEFYDVNDIGNRLHQIVKHHLGINFNFYMLRHLFSNQIRNSDPRTIMELMGHNNLSMTLKYSYSSDELKEKTLRQFYDNYCHKIDDNVAKTSLLVGDRGGSSPLARTKNNKKRR